MRLLSRLALVLVPVLLGGLGCRPSPCVTCQIWRYKGQAVEDYLKSSPGPDKVIEEKDGTRTYLFFYTRSERAPAPPMAPQAEARSGDHGASPLDLIPLLLRSLFGGAPESPRPLGTDRIETAFVLTVHTDAKGLIRDYTCDKISVRLQALSLL